MPLVELFGPSEQDGENVAGNTSRLINQYRERSGGAADFVLKSTPGMSVFAQLPSIPGRAIAVVNGMLFCIAGTSLYEVAANGSTTGLGSVGDDDFPEIQGYESNVMVAAGGSYYVYDGSSLLPVSGGAFTKVGSLTFMNGYTILTEQGGAKFEWTDLGDPSSRNAANTATAEARDDDLLTCEAIGGFVYLFGTESIEIWGLTGQAGVNAFQRVSGGVLDIGLKSKGLFVNIGGAAFFVGNDDLPYILTGNSVQPIYSPAVQTALEESTPTHCFYFEDRGHKFCVIRFSDRPAFVYDISSGEWHERGEQTNLSAWTALDCVNVYGGWKVVNSTGVVSSLASTNADYGLPLIRRAISRTMEWPEPTSPTLEITCRKGHNAHPVDLIARFSDDGGETWSSADPRSIGGAGSYDQKAVWYEGAYERFTVSVDVTEPYEVPIYSKARVSV